MNIARVGQFMVGMLISYPIIVLIPGALGIVTAFIVSTAYWLMVFSLEDR